MKSNNKTKVVWQVVGTSRSLQRLHIAANGQNIAAVFTSSPDAETNAAHIVKALNEREELIEALKNARNQLSLWKLNDRWDASDDDALATIDEVLTKAEQ